MILKPLTDSRRLFNHCTEVVCVSAIVCNLRVLISQRGNSSYKGNGTLYLLDKFFQFRVQSWMVVTCYKYARHAVMLLQVNFVHERSSKC